MWSRRLAVPRPGFQGHEVARTENNGTCDVTMALSVGHDRVEWAAW